MCIFLIPNKIEYIFYTLIGHLAIINHEIQVQIFCLFYFGLYSFSPFSNILILGVMNRSPLLYIYTKISYPSFHKILCIKEYSENVISHVLE